jgi:hypothetical protein
MGVLRNLVDEEKEPMPEAGKSCLRQTGLDSLSRKTTRLRSGELRRGTPVLAKASLRHARRRHAFSVTMAGMQIVRRQISRSLKCPFCSNSTWHSLKNGFTS